MSAAATAEAEALGNGDRFQVQLAIPVSTLCRVLVRANQAHADASVHIHVAPVIQYHEPTKSSISIYSAQPNAYGLGVSSLVLKAVGQLLRC